MKNKNNKIQLFILLVNFLVMLPSAMANLSQIMPVRVYPPHEVNINAVSLQPDGLTPQQVRKAYGFTLVSGDGEGQTIGIVNAFDAPYIEKDLKVFSQAFNLPACNIANGCLKIIYANGKRPQAHSTWSLETALDLEWAHAIAPKAKLVLVEAKSNLLEDLKEAVQVAINEKVNVISMSWGTFEFESEFFYDAMFKNQQVAFVAASGDFGNGTFYPAASPYVIAVGGTSLKVDESGNYVDEIAWIGSGGGLSLFESEPDFQASIQIPHNPEKKRGIPDVAYHADPIWGYSVFASIYANGEGRWLTVGGTSAGTPQWAALIAIANSSGGSKGIYMIERLYSIFRKKPEAFKDIIKGANGYCGYYCEAHTGYDYVTGLGSPHANLLVELIKGHI